MYAGIAIALVCSILSPLVVLKRLSFVGQGISHAAFGGIGIAVSLVALGLVPAAALPSVQYPVVLVFCLACALLIAAMTERTAENADTSIGIVLVASMTLGAILIQWSVSHMDASWRAAHNVRSLPVQGWESVLFGSIVAVRMSDAAIAWIAAIAIVATLSALRRPLMFWAFDEAAAPAFGVPARSMKLLLVVLLTLAIVTAMKLAGVVLATALLVLPGATALRLSPRLAPVLLWSLACGVIGVLAGLVASFEIGALPPGACIVGVLVLLYSGARLISGVQSARRAS